MMSSREWHEMDEEQTIDRINEWKRKNEDYLPKFADQVYDIKAFALEVFLDTVYWLVITCETVVLPPGSTARFKLNMLKPKAGWPTLKLCHPRHINMSRLMPSYEFVQRWYHLKFDQIPLGSEWALEPMSSDGEICVKIKIGAEDKYGPALVDICKGSVVAVLAVDDMCYEDSEDA